MSFSDYTCRTCKRVVESICSAAALLSATSALAQLPAVPSPAENPPTEAKRVLGKILFWDEQLSWDNTVACGTCHLPGAGGADTRAGRHPGTDAGTIDDVRGSPGIALYDISGARAEHPVFAMQPQVTPRISPSNFMALWADAIFWDGRAGPEFTDPESGEILITSGGALESQVIEALSNPAEMARSGHDWARLNAKLAAAAPLALASELPPDVSAAIERTPDYPELFAAAFGDAEITAARIAFAIADYQRTLVADMTAWDRLQAGEATALSESAMRGWRDFQAFLCDSCHVPPLFTNNDFFNIGLRLASFDAGRMTVTGDIEDAGEMKVPSLRNVGLRRRFMHTGQFNTLAAAISFYLTAPALEHRDTMPNGTVYAFNMGVRSEIDIRSFLEEGLTDPRVRDEAFPFDRPKLNSERAGD